MSNFAAVEAACFLEKPLSMTINKPRIKTCRSILQDVFLNT